MLKNILKTVDQVAKLNTKTLHLFKSNSDAQTILIKSNSFSFLTKHKEQI